MFSVLYYVVTTGILGYYLGFTGLHPPAAQQTQVHTHDSIPPQFPYRQSAIS